VSTPPAKHIYELGPLRLDTEKRLLRDGELVPLTPELIGILLTLVERPGQLVKRDELRNAVWPEVSVRDENLSVRRIGVSGS